MDRNTFLLILITGFLLLVMAKDRGLFTKPLTSNAEVWEWTDYRGHTYKMSVSRDMH